ncbi:fimbrial biogenesis outer membrane usher protein [Klebsiella huaxiensis]|uniref:Fimbrial biogenesis outer membrane usher protein n=1 Tax=Klebsiella huaxiensis TaxID=2153354 RepID=A0ABT6EDY6_9ENTR|nr:fimbria/pilus outer membrane usher protein [Klebsiella huaxiensis]MDG1643632.1 fimbrial biogenesis outer membrane usher protein [Klebsiella huaxiensis]QBG08063.1 fimbrial biogenesis outer membrane usher protein [Klebsiella huaxiensis]VUT05638.1 putative outer membrane usher protein ElfC [Klebsiella huaxiensis]
MTGYGKQLSAGFVLSAFVAPVHHALAVDSEYETQFLRKDKHGATAEVFLYRNAVTPGLKTVDFTLNDRFIDRYSILFVEDRQNKTTVPCLSTAFLQQLGIRTEQYNGWRLSADADGDIDPATLTSSQCEDVTARIPASTVSYDNSLQTLSLQVPQEAVKRIDSAMLSPKEWDDGVANLRTSYSGYFYQSQLKDVSENDEKISRNAWISLNSTGGAGPWRLFSTDSFSKNEGNGWETNHDSLYLNRGIAAARGHISIGDIFTQSRSAILNNIPLRGVTLATTERMMLDNQFDFSPVIRGIARTNAKVTIRQQNSTIYSTTVTPGAFAIDDLSSARSGADLEVTIEEADGSRQVFRVPYSTLPTMIRPGALRYSAAVGQYRQNSHAEGEPWLGFGSLEYGFEHLTLLSTTLVAEDYQSLSAGAAWNIGAIGAFSLELAGARYRETWQNEAQKNGSALRVLYARYFESTDTNLQVAGHQYHSQGFMDFSDYMERYHHEEVNGYAYGDEGWNRRRRSRTEINLNQGLNTWGNLYFSLSQDRYYHTSEKNSTLTAGGGTQIGPASVSLTWSWTKSDQSKDNQLNLNVSIPFDWGKRQHNAGSLNYGLTRNRENQYSQTLGYSGNALDNALTYSANLQRDPGGGTSESLSLGYGSSIGSVNGSIGHSDDVMQFSAGMSGGLVIYSGGILLTPMLGDTIGIIETPDAKGIQVSGNSSTNTDRWGRTVLSYMTPYRYNTLTLDTSKTEGVELKESSRKVIPTQGAAVLLHFATRVGRRAMVEIRSRKPIPLGALIYVEGEKDEAGIVGNKGQAYLSGIAADREQKMRVQWGDMPAQRCYFLLPVASGAQLEPNNWYQKIAVQCQ